MPYRGLSTAYLNIAQFTASSVHAELQKVVKLPPGTSLFPATITINQFQQHLAHLILDKQQVHKERIPLVVL